MYGNVIENRFQPKALRSTQFKKISLEVHSKPREIIHFQFYIKSTQSMEILLKIVFIPSHWEVLNPWKLTWKFHPQLRKMARVQFRTESTQV